MELENAGYAIRAEPLRIRCPLTRQQCRKFFFQGIFRMSKTNRKVWVSGAAAALFLLGSGTSFAAGTKLEGQLLATNSGLQSGKAKHEADRGRLKASVQVEDLAPNTNITIKICGASTNTRTNAFGFADLNLDSRKGSTVPECADGNRDVLVSDDGGPLLQGTLAPR